MQESRPRKSISKRDKLASSSHSKAYMPEHSGLLSKAPGPQPYKYIFNSSSNDQRTSFCSCVPGLYELKS